MADPVLLFGKPDDPAATRQGVVDSLHRILSDGAQLKAFPSHFKRSLEWRVWEQERRAPSGKIIPPCSLHDFIHEPYATGLGASYEAVENLIRDRADVLALWTEVTKRKPGGANNPHGRSGKPEGEEINLDNIQDDKLSAPTGTSAAAGLRKLQKAAEEGNSDATRELAAVIAGEKKVHRACVDAGLRKSAKIDADVKQRCDRANAARAAEYMPHETLEAFISDLFAAGHKSLAIEIKNLIGESIMDRNYGSAAR